MVTTGGQVNFFNSLILVMALTIKSHAYVEKKELIRLPAAQRLSIRVEHSKELMGKYYQRSIVRKYEKQAIYIDVHTMVKNALPNKWKSRAWPITDMIFEMSDTYRFDPIFLLAMIDGESSFNPEAVGGVGEIGLMQIRPSTAKWIANKLDITYEGNKTLYNPMKNIRIGAGYMNYLRTKFKSHGQLYLAAYNMGPTQLGRNIKIDRWPKEYPMHIMKRYIAYYKKMPL